MNKLDLLRDDLDPIILSDYDDVPLENISNEEVVQDLFERYRDEDTDDELLLKAIRDLLAEMENRIEDYAQYLIDHKEDYEECETEEEVVDAAEGLNLLITYFEARRAAHKFWKEVRQ